VANELVDVMPPGVGEASTTSYVGPGLRELGGSDPPVVTGADDHHVGCSRWNRPRSGVAGPQHVLASFF